MSVIFLPLPKTPIVSVEGERGPERGGRRPATVGKEQDIELQAGASDLDRNVPSFLN